jgi:hypothetical protein
MPFGVKNPWPCYWAFSGIISTAVGLKGLVILCGLVSSLSFFWLLRLLQSSHPHLVLSSSLWRDPTRFASKFQWRRNCLPHGARHALEHRPVHHPRTPPPAHGGAGPGRGHGVPHRARLCEHRLRPPRRRAGPYCRWGIRVLCRIRSPASAPPDAGLGLRRRRRHAGACEPRFQLRVSVLLRLRQHALNALRYSRRRKSFSPWALNPPLLCFRGWQLCLCPAVSRSVCR